MAGTSLRALALACLFCFGCEREASRLKRYDAAITLAENEYILGKGDPQVALARVEAAIDEGERHFKNGYGHETFELCRVILIFRRLRDASLRSDSDEADRQARLLEKFVADRHYPLDPPFLVNGRLDQTEVIRFITRWDKNYLEALKKTKFDQPIGT